MIYGYYKSIFNVLRYLKKDVIIDFEFYIQ